MRLNKYGDSKCMIENDKGTYTFLNVTMWEAFKFWVSLKIKNSVGVKNGKKKSN